MKNDTKELIAECVNQIQAGMRQVEDAIERLEKATPIRVCDPFHSTDTYKRAHGTEFTVHVHRGIKVLAECLEKEIEHPKYDPGYGNPREEEDRVAVINGDFLWFQLGEKTGYTYR